MEIQLYTDNTELLASDGIMYVDGRLALRNIRNEVIQRNSRYAKNFPHKVATAFALYKGRRVGQIIQL